MRAAATGTAPAASPGTLPAGHRVAGARSRARELALVPPVRAGAPRAPFVVLLGGLLTAGLGGLLFLHTSLAEDSFRLHDLTTRSAVLAGREQALEQEVAVAASPERLAARAEALGMVRSENPAFIRLSDGSVLGKPKPGVAPPPPSPAPTSSPEPSQAPRAGSTHREGTPSSTGEPSR
jgi:hypothetical protein